MSGAARQPTSTVSGIGLSRPRHIVLIMADQLAASALGCYGHPVAQTPHLDALAQEGCLFTRAYCNSPICAASRASLMTGRLPSEVGVYDNGAELPAAVPTFCHALRARGYRTVLAGKMHFVGPDQLHGFEERLTTDIYPAGFQWTPDWGQGLVHNPGASVRELADAGPCAASMQIDYDEEVAFRARQCIFDQARCAAGDRPLFLCVSFTHPHDPFSITPEYWSLYAHREVPPPRAPAEPLEVMHPYARWVQIHHELDRYAPEPAVVTGARRAYFGMVSYLDGLVGRVLGALRASGLYGDTAVLFTADHGEMLGEHGMWYKRVFYEDSARVPLLLAWPGHTPVRREARVVSLLDLAPTLCDLAGVWPPRSTASSDALAAHFRGDSLWPLAAPVGQAALPDAASVPGLGPLEIGETVETPETPGTPEGARGWKDEAVSEYLGEGVVQPCRMLVRGRYKAVFVRGEAGQLFDLDADPLEMRNLSGRPEVEATEAAMRERLLAGFDPDQVYAAVRDSQAVRRSLAAALACGRTRPWDFVPDAYRPERYVRAETVPSAAARRHLPAAKDDGPDGGGAGRDVARPRRGS